ncbi:FBP domain-containing protein [Oerskovia turbata]|uniref:FBP domain-containing protein n=1 Tax=Oerskovia turbata TaxID=1713 RepID=A0A4Q1KPB8_9CELL|nr:FBP domain-containing protein [Oerskovia turbata]RXR22778.1 FBP domain-containing protein [Oerskovia turbata]RXR30724.1 FBP domain-containing protein [Oerskovia turbata]TGJ95998.1 FBP domain-containing protein [Actinotalea fermentans ATCC 43279 = JCM 9966 = DSM 3133]
MIPLTEKQIRASFVNASRRESSQLTLPSDLADLRWDRLDYLGWVDRKAPLRAYAVVPVDDTLVGLALRAPEGAASRRRAVCAWCEDVVATDDVSLYVVRRAGAAGRNGDTIGTLICTTFECSKNVRRKPTVVEAGQDPAGLVERRIEGLRERSAKFAREVLREV